MKKFEFFPFHICESRSVKSEFSDSGNNRNKKHKNNNNIKEKENNIITDEIKIKSSNKLSQTNYFINKNNNNNEKNK